MDASKTNRRWWHNLYCATCVLTLLGLGQSAGSDRAIADESPKAITPSPDNGGHAYTNRLIHSNDPYLLLHAHNPVDWYPWGPEALAKAKRENKPIFLSIGYSTCYWCHVAERTIYSNPEIARLMNRWFINIKVDREQRPDLDEIYMLATDLMTGQGGWPNNVFLTPDLKPIFAGSYFPPADDAMGRPGFPTVLRTIHEAWTAHRQDVIASAERVYKVMQQARQEKAAAAAPLTPATWLERARDAWLRRVDSEQGGFPSGDRGMKFPQEPVLAMLLADYRMSHHVEDLEVLTRTLNAMALGGVHDQLGGGFHRYSTDKTWSIPHFEKMLYDNAQLLTIYAEAYQLTQDPLYRYVAESVREYLTRRMAAPEGGFYTAEDAEMRGEEGASYLWTRQEITSNLGAEGAHQFFGFYALVPMPAQEGEAILSDSERGVLRVDSSVVKPTRILGGNNIVKRLSDLAPLRQKLLAARDRRPQPLRDEKIIVGLNGLAIEAFVQSGQVFQRPEDIAVARHVAERIWSLAYDPKSGRLQHEIFRGRAQTDGYLDDYALLGRGMLSLNAATGEAVWRNRAALLAEAILKRFQRRDGSLATAAGGNSLPIPPRDSGDNIYPSGTSAAIHLFKRLAEATGKATYATAADRALRRMSNRIQQDPEVWPVLVVAANIHPARPVTNSDEPAAETGSAAAVPAPSHGTSKKPSSLSTASHVRVTAEIRDAGDQDQIIITLRVDRGYHINANPASLDYLIPTSVSFEELTPAKITYPSPVRVHPAFAQEGLNVYEGEVPIVAVMPKEILSKRKSLRAMVSAQTCTEQVCLPPAKLPVVVRISE